MRPAPAKKAWSCSRRDRSLSPSLMPKYRASCRPFLLNVKVPAPSRRPVTYQGSRIVSRGSVSTETIFSSSLTRVKCFHVKTFHPERLRLQLEELGLFLFPA